MSAPRSVIEEFTSTDLSSVSDDELSEDAVEIGRAIDLLTHRLGAVTVEVGRRGSHLSQGFLNLTSWLAATVDMDHATARRHVTLAKTLSAHPETSRRFATGDLSYGRVRILARAAAAFADLYRRDEEMLLGFARDMTLRDLVRAVGYWSNCADATRAEDEARHQRERAYLHASPTLGGMVKIDGLVDKETGEAILAAFDAAMTPQARQDATPHEGTTENTEAPSPDVRSAPQRRAEALAEICRQFLDNFPGVVGGNRPHVSLIVDLDTLLGRTGKRCDLSHTGTVTPETARRILCDAQVSRVIVAGDSVPLEMGRAVRTATPTQLKALAIRDGGCTWAGCDRPPSWCDAHHIVHWLDGGPTDLANLRLLCRRHHTLIHRDDSTRHHTIHRE